MLSSHKIVAFISTTSPERARAFFRDKLGLPLVSEDGFALVFDGNGTRLRVSIVRELTPAKFTVLGWQVDNIEAEIEALAKAGVTFNRYGLPGQNEQGVWSAPGGTKVAWFDDPDGNILSLSQHV